jgi:hypothetical protein
MIEQLAADTWKELGFQLKAVGKRMLVRTEVLPQKMGSLYLPSQYSETFGQRLGAKVPITAHVLSKGSRVSDAISVGDRLLFPRLVFGWTHRLADKTYVGWVEEAEVLAHAGDAEIAPFFGD